MTPATHPARTPQRKRTIGGLLSTAALVIALMGVGTAPASAAVVPQATGATCGWSIQDISPSSPFWYKITTTGLPNVTGTSETPARVYLKVSFLHRPDEVYRTGMFYTDVVAGQWSTSWTSVQEKTSGWTSVQDAGGESGYTGAELTVPDTFVLLQLNWYNTAGTAVDYQYDQLASAPNSFNAENVCNAGANFA